MKKANIFLSIAAGIFIFVLGMIFDHRYQPFEQDKFLTITVDREDLNENDDKVLYKIMLKGEEDGLYTGSNVSVTRVEEGYIKNTYRWPFLPKQVKSSIETSLNSEINWWYIKDLTKQPK